MGNSLEFPAVKRLLLGRSVPNDSLRYVVAAVCFSVMAGALAGADSRPAAATAYRQAMESFNQDDFAHALAILESAPEAAKASDQADAWNLRGAIFLHQHRYPQAREAFEQAIAKDSGLWAARFNLAEVDFRQKKYDASNKEYAALLGHTSHWLQHSDERVFLEYKILLTQVLSGKEKDTQAYLAQHRRDRTPPLIYYYLNAAVEQHHGHARQSEQWLAQADAHYSPSSEELFAESFRLLGWNTERADKLIAAARRHDAASSTPASMAMVELIPNQPAAPAPVAAMEKPVGLPAVAVVPEATPAPAFRTTPPPAPAANLDDLAAAQMPPPADNLEATSAGAPESPAATNALQVDSRAVYAQPIVLAKPTPAKGKAPADSSPSDDAATPAASPASAVPVAVSATPSPSAAPGPTPAPAFMAKYEQAYVKFLQKDYAAAKSLLDEADAIQSGQAASTSLRSQIFKHFYEGAYVSYKKGDYAGAVGQLDDADNVEANQPDALNLRGLTYSKQKDYEHAETAFKKAIAADPTFWAARFNYAELPFNRQNYTAARARFEDLYSQTDAAKQPREAELTQFKVFLTLLLEGKVDGARSFMQHLSFTGATPARYFCQAALEFYGGNTEQALNEIDDANKNYMPQLVAIFKESFYRIGWINDAGTGPGTAVAAIASASPGASVAPSPEMGASPAGTPAVVVAMQTPMAATPAASVVPVFSPTPTPKPVVVAMATPVPQPSLVPATPVPTPLAVVTPTPRPSVALVTPSPTAVAVATPTPRPSLASVTPSPTALAVATPTPRPSLAAVTPVPTAVAVAKPTAKPTEAIATAALTSVTPYPRASAGPTIAQAKSASSPASVAEETSRLRTAARPSKRENLYRKFIVIFVLGNIAWSFIQILSAVLKRKPRRTLPVTRSPLYASNPVDEEPDEVEVPRR